MTTTNANHEKPDDSFGKNLGKTLLQGVAWGTGTVIATVVLGPVAVPVILAIKAIFNGGDSGHSGPDLFA